MFSTDLLSQSSLNKKNSLFETVEYSNSIIALSLSIFSPFTSLASPVCYSKCAELPELYHQGTNHPLGARTSAYELQCHSLDQKRKWNSLHNRGRNLYND